MITKKKVSFVNHLQKKSLISAKDQKNFTFWQRIPKILSFIKGSLKRHEFLKKDHEKNMIFVRGLLERRKFYQRVTEKRQISLRSSCKDAKFIKGSWKTYEFHQIISTRMIILLKAGMLRMRYSM